MAGRLLRKLLLAACGLGLLTAPACRAQAKYAGTGPGALLTVGGLINAFDIDYGQRDLGGVGVFADINPTWRFGIEAEAQMLRLHQQADTHISTALVGPRLSLRPHKLNPYVKVLTGIGLFNFPYDYAHGTYFVIAPGAGVDYRISPRVKLRLIDFEYQEWPQFSFGPIHPYGISAGISFAVMRGPTKMGKR